MTEELLIQKDMNKFYEYLNSDEFKKYLEENNLTGFEHCYVKDFMISKGEKDAERINVSTALGNFNYQVENGGIHQWFYNNYYKHGLPILLDFLPRVTEYYLEATDKYQLANMILTNLIKIAEYEDYTANTWTTDCLECNGTGYYEDDEEENTSCEECGGTGTIETDDFSEIISHLLPFDFDSKFYRFDSAEIFNEYIKNFDKIMKNEGEDMSNVNTESKRIKVKLSGQDGNVFNLIGLVVREMRRNKVDMKTINEFQNDVASSKSYDEALQTIMKYVNVC